MLIVIVNSIATTYSAISLLLKIEPRNLVLKIYKTITSVKALTTNVQAAPSMPKFITSKTKAQMYNGSSIKLNKKTNFGLPIP